MTGLWREDDTATLLIFQNQFKIRAHNTHLMNDNCSVGTIHHVCYLALSETYTIHLHTIRESIEHTSIDYDVVVYVSRCA